MTGQTTVLFCVGATKAATSWLYRYLAAHPDCHLRSIKELHYFDALEEGRLRVRRKAVEADLLMAQAREADGRGNDYLTRVIRDLTDWVAVLSRGHNSISAYLGYLFDGIGSKRLVADITPAYSLLSVDRLRMMAGIAPDVRFLYLLRDPVARMWSSARMLGRRRANGRGEFPAKSVEAMEQMLSAVEWGRKDREDYEGTIARLREAVAPERLLILLQDELMTVPGIARLCRFLGIADHPADFETRHHEGLPLALPDDLRARAQRALRPQYDFVATLFPDLPDSWRRNMTEVHG